MPRANRYFIPGYVWHITHRCHQREFLLKFERDRRRYLHWVFEAKKRLVCACWTTWLYPITSIYCSKIQAKRSSSRACSSSPGARHKSTINAKNATGAFWEDRYHATAVEADQHLNRCLVYIDLNMVRAGVVSHPEKWKESGFTEIQKPPSVMQ